MGERLIKIGILIGVVAVLVGMPVACVFWMTSVPGRSYVGPLPPLTPEQARAAARLRFDVTSIASVPHNVGHPAALEASARHIERSLGAMGYRVARQAYGVEQDVRNIEVVIEPAQTQAPTLVIGAHYDSWGDAPGANDNGSGAAALIEIARQLHDLQGRAMIRIRLVFFVNEEPPYFQTARMGSFIYAQRLERSGEKIRGMISLETLGYYTDREGSQRYPPPLGMFYPARGNFVAFVGLTSSRSFVRQTVKTFRAVASFPSEGGTAPGFVRGMDWSDHWSFDQAGFPALMVTDTAPFRYPHYHQESDVPEKVNYEQLSRVVWGLSQMIRVWASSTRAAL